MVGSSNGRHSSSERELSYCIGHRHCITLYDRIKYRNIERELAAYLCELAAYFCELAGSFCKLNAYFWDFKQCGTDECFGVARIQWS